MNITWESTRYRCGTYDGYLTDGVLVKRIDNDNVCVYWCKWVYYTIVKFNSLEDYKNGVENSDEESCYYVGLEDDVPHHRYNTFNHSLWFQENEGEVYEIHPRRFASVNVHLPSGEVDWESWENGESYVDDVFIIKDGKMVRYEDEEG